MPRRIAVTKVQVEQWRQMYSTDLMSLRDIARRFGLATNTVRKHLLLADMVFDKPSHISVKNKGRMSPRKGVKLPPERVEAIRQRATGNKYCVGRICSEETRKRMKAAITRRNERWKAEGRIMSTEERSARNHVRQTAKRLVHRVLKLTGKRRETRSEKLLGYTKDQLRAHIEAQFRDGMSWQKRDSFHIDHRFPVAEFLRRGVTDIATINALSNLQVLTPHENHRKSDSVSPVWN